MFESFFEKLGRKVTRHSGKIIVIWIVLVVLMGYGALLVFSNTNFNIQSGFGSSNSMSEKASNELSRYFNSSAGTGSTGSFSELIVVTQNTYVNSTPDFENLVKYQDSTLRSLSNDKNFKGVESIVTTENQSLNAFANGTKKILNGNYGIVSGLSCFESGVLVGNRYFVGVEACYNSMIHNSFNNNHNITQSKMIAYRGAMIKAIYLDSEFHTNAFALFLNLTADYVNYSLVNINNTIPVIQTGGIIASLNSKFNSTLLVNPVFKNLYPLLKFTIGRQNLSAFILSEKNSTINLTSQWLNVINNQNHSLYEKFYYLIYKIDDSNFTSVLTSIYGQFGKGIVLNPLQIDSISKNLTINAMISQFNGNPLVFVDKSALPNFVTELNNSTPVAITDSYMNSMSLFNMPVQPTPYLLHNFVGVNNSTTIFIYTFNGNYTTSVANNITHTSRNYEKKFVNGSFLIAGTEEFASQLEGEITTGLVSALGTGIILSIIVVGVFFRSVRAAFIPIMLFIISAIVSLGIVGYLYTYVFHTGVSFITPTLLFIFILGLSSDYSVYLMARYRRELRHGEEHPTISSSRWAGHAVFTSGLTVIISEFVLWLANIPFFSDAGLANTIGVAVTLALATTFLLSILHRFGKKIFKRSANGPYSETDHRVMNRVGKFSTTHKNAMIAIFIVFALVGLTVYEVTPTGIDMLKLLPKSQAISAIEAVNNSFNGDFFDRNFIVVGLQSPLVNNGTFNMSELAVVTNIENETLNTKGISMVLGPGRPYGYYTGLYPSSVPSKMSSTYVNQSLTFVSKSNSRYVEIVFQTYYLGWGTKAIDTVNTLYSHIKPAGTSSYTVEIGGLTQSLSDALSSTQSSFSELIPILTITIFIILLIQLSSILTPLRLILMVIAAVLVSLSVSYVIFHYIQGFPVVIFMPVFVFITLLAVGLDYDIFMITRVREEVMKGRGLRDALITSVSENGSVIMLLGLLLFVTFAALYLSAIPLIQEIGIGVGLGVLIDTFISWPFFIPAVMLLIKKYNWWPSKLMDKS